MRDTEIIAAIGSRNEDVMRFVIDKYSRLLWPIASAVLQNVGNEQDVEEIVADAFIYLWNHPQTFAPERGSLKTLLCVIVRSRAIDRYRNLTRRQTVPLEEAVLSAGMGMQERMIAAESNRELIAAVNALGEPAREILIRRYYHGQKPRQIAIALGMTVKQVDNFLYRTKKHLRTVFSPE